MNTNRTHAFPDSISLTGRVAEYMEGLLEAWTLEFLPYSAFVDNFRKERLNGFAGGETWGKAVRCACLHYRYSRNPELLALIRRTVREVLACERENGSISCARVEDQPDSAGGDLWERKYVLLGLEHYLRDVEEDAGVLASMIRQVDCLISQIGDPPKTPVTLTGWSPNKLESSTILQPVMLLYHRTGEPRFLEFADYIVGQGGCDGYDLIEEALHRVPPHEMAGGIYPKAYEMMSFFMGVMEYQVATGDPRCREAVLALFESICEGEITLLGSGGGDAPHQENGECWDHTACEQTHPELDRCMETCVAATWVQFCTAVHRLSGDSRAVDEIERTLFNALLGAAKPTGDKFSYMNRLNGVKCDPEGWGVWVPKHGTVTCCDLNGFMGLACAKQMVAGSFADGAALNLFLPGQIGLTLMSGNRIELKVESTYPFDAAVRIRVCADVPERFCFRIRIPVWSDRPSVVIDGQEQDAVPGSYTEIHREWAGETEIALDLGMKIKTRLSRKHHRIAIERGPVVFARDENMDLDFDAPVDLSPEEGALEARIEKPFYQTVWQQLEIPTRDGGSFRVVDWASINNWNGRRTCTWLPLSST